MGLLERAYTDDDGNLYYVSFGTGKSTFKCKGFCLMRNPQKGQRREYGIAELTYRHDYDQAQRELDEWARMRGLRQIERSA